jgi:4-diphosphocytidyl-2-C-methyl-D-erythritol kinase
VSEVVRRRAHAKLNVFLRVLGRRDDGYHDIETLMLPLDLHDEVTVARADGLMSMITAVRAGVEAAVSLDDEDLALVAARALAEEAGRLGLRDPSTLGAQIAIRKAIPIAGGMGGGSADAAASLDALDELWGLGLGREGLRAVAARIGSDVPAMLEGAAVLATGRGEHLTPVHAAGSIWVVKPFGFGVRAADAYAWWDDDPRIGPDTGVLVAALETGNAEVLGDALFDDLQPGVSARHPQVAAAIERFLEAGALGAIMTGSGPTVVALARHLGHAESLRSAVGGSFVVGGPPSVGQSPPAG